MSKSTIQLHNSHDFLTKASFGHKEVLQDFLSSRLPQETLQRIDMNSLRLTNKSFNTHKGKEKHCDIVYSANISGQAGYLYISLEHQSKEEEHMPLRQLEYNISLMRQHLKEGHKTLPLIVNICLYNGLAPYQGPVTLLELFEDPELAKQYLLEAYHLVDLNSDSVEQIKKDKKAALVELVLKQGIYRDFCRWLDAYESLLSAYQVPYHEVVYQYMYTLDPDKDAILERIGRIKDPTQRRIAMTAAQHLRQEGMQQGIQQGKREGMQQGKREGMYTKSIEIARHMLSNMQLDIKTVSQATGLSTKTLKRLSEKQP